MTASLQKTHVTTLHGVLLSIAQVGVLITGDAGVGKSSAALQLIDRGHALVADDIITVQRVEHEIIGTCPEPLQDLLKVRGVEIFNVRKLFGDRAIVSSLPIQLVIALDPTVEIPVLDEQTGTQTILSIKIPRVTLSNRHHDLALLIETIVKAQLLNTQGYNAQREFIANTRVRSGVTV